MAERILDRLLFRDDLLSDGEASFVRGMLDTRGPSARDASRLEAIFERVIND
jgi:hypothetical protein